MGIFKSLFHRTELKMEYSHIRMLTKDCVALILNTLGMLKRKQGNDVYLDEVLDSLLTDMGYDSEKEKSIKDLKTKFSRFVSYYVVKNLGREMDLTSDDNEVLNEEIEKYWNRIIESKNMVK